MSSDGARCLKVGVHEKPDLPDAFHERRAHKSGGESGAFPSSRKKWMNLALAEMQFPVVLRGLLALFSLFWLTFSIPHTSPHPTLTISVQIWTNYETHIFQNLGRYAIDRVLTPKMLSGSLADAKVALYQTKRQCSANHHIILALRWRVDTVLRNFLTLTTHVIFLTS